MQKRKSIAPNKVSLLPADAQDSVHLKSGSSTLSHRANNKSNQYIITRAGDNLEPQANLSDFHSHSKAMYNDPGEMSQGQSSAHANVSWMSTLPELGSNLCLILGGAQSLLSQQREAQLNQAHGSQSMSPKITTRDADVSNDTEWILESELDTCLDDLMEIIAEDGFIASPHLN